MSALDLKPGDDIAYLLDRKAISHEDDLTETGDGELVRMAGEWLREHAARFFFTVARNYQPIADSTLNTFDSHDDSVLFPDKAALLAALPQLAAATAGALWVIVASRDVEDAARAAITSRPH